MTTATAVRHEITVSAPQERAFEVFTRDFNRWWPRTHKLGEAELAEAVLEEREGGRWYERDVDGGECEWGTVLVWEPPSRLVLSWQISSDWAYDPDLLTEVEVSFVSAGPDQTRVALEHRGLDAYGDRMEAVRSTIDGPGGWPGVLEKFAQGVAAA